MLFKEFPCGKDLCQAGTEFCYRTALLCFRCSAFEDRCFTDRHITDCTEWCRGRDSTTTSSWSTSGLPNTEEPHTDTLEWLIPLIVLSTLFVLAALGCFFIRPPKSCLVNLSSYVLGPFRRIWKSAKNKLQCLRRNGIPQDEENAGNTDNDYYHVRKPIPEVDKEHAIYRPNNVVPATENGEGNSDLQPSHQEELRMARLLPHKGCDSSDSTQELLQECPRSS